MELLKRALKNLGFYKDMISQRLQWEFIAVCIYFAILTLIGLLSIKKQKSDTDFLMGGRGLNYWLTALAAHASDMSSWLFMGYPAMIYAGGLINAWTAIGLFVFMFLNWQLMAPKIRVATEQYNSLTFSSYFENRFADTSGSIRLTTALMAIGFYIIYISAGLVGLGFLMDILFGMPYHLGILVGILLVVPYVFFGGYTTLAWIDLFQGLFLLCVIVFVPLFVMGEMGGWDAVVRSIQAKGLSLDLFPRAEAGHSRVGSFMQILLLAGGWGLGYFGQPHIVTKFMGIKYVGEIFKSKWIGMCWMFIALAGSTLVGLVGAAFFQHQELANDERVFITMVRDVFHPFVVGFLLCAVLAATINAMSSQVLVLSTNLTEDFYKRFFRRKAAAKELLLVSRIGILAVAVFAYLIAFLDISSIYGLVLYAWSGLGASFGPLLLLSLYSKQVNRYGAWAGIVVGGGVSALWPILQPYVGVVGFDIPPLIPGFLLSLLMILSISLITRQKVLERTL